MAFDPNDITADPKPRAPIIFLFGKNGSGKTTFLESIPNNFVFDLEDKLFGSSMKRYVPKTYQDLRDGLKWLEQEFATSEKKPFGAISIDTLDCLQMKLQENFLDALEALHKRRPKTVSDSYFKETNYGSGNVAVANRFNDEILNVLTGIRNKYNVPIILTSQTEIEQQEDPTDGNYHIHDSRLQKNIKALISDKVDAKLYIKISTTVDQDGNRIPLDNERIIQSGNCKGVEAKNSLNLPAIFKVSKSNGWQDLVNQINTIKV